VLNLPAADEHLTKSALGIVTGSGNDGIRLYCPAGVGGAQRMAGRRKSCVASLPRKLLAQSRFRIGGHLQGAVTRQRGVARRGGCRGAKFRKGNGLRRITGVRRAPKPSHRRAPNFSAKRDDRSGSRSLSQYSGLRGGRQDKDLGQRRSGRAAGRGKPVPQAARGAGALSKPGFRGPRAPPLRGIRANKLAQHWRSLLRSTPVAGDAVTVHGPGGDWSIIRPQRWAIWTNRWPKTWTCPLGSPGCERLRVASQRRARSESPQRGEDHAARGCGAAATPGERPRWRANPNGVPEADATPMGLGRAGTTSSRGSGDRRNPGLEDQHRVAVHGAAIAGSKPRLITSSGETVTDDASLRKTDPPGNTTPAPFASSLNDAVELVNDVDVTVRQCAPELLERSRTDRASRKIQQPQTW